MFLRVGSANYAAKVWVNGTVVAEHLGGHLPFVAEITGQLAWDRKNVITIAVENRRLPECPTVSPDSRDVIGDLRQYAWSTPRSSSGRGS